MPRIFFRFGNFFSSQLSPNISVDNAFTIQRNLTFDPHLSQLGFSRSRTSERHAEPQMLQTKLDGSFATLPLAGTRPMEFDSNMMALHLHSGPQSQI